MVVSIMLTSHWVTTEKAIEYHEKHLKNAIQIGDRRGDRRAYENLGNAYQ